MLGNKNCKVKVDDTFFKLKKKVKKTKIIVLGAGCEFVTITNFCKDKLSGIFTMKRNAFFIPTKTIFKNSWLHYFYILILQSAFMKAVSIYMK